MKTGRKIFVTALAVLILLSFPFLAGAAGEASIVSGYYGIDRAQGLLGRIDPGTPEQTVLDRVVSGPELSLSDGIKTGSVLSDGTSSLTLVVQADCNGDGGFSITDALMVKSHLLQLQEFSPAQLEAGDVSRDGSITITDFLQMKSQLLGLSDFTPGQLVSSEAQPAVILTPGDTLAFGDASAPMEQVGTAAVWAEGTVTASAIGTARFTQGETSLVVTVCETPLTLTLPEKPLYLDPGGTARLQPQLNYPVPADIRYEISDEAIATVDENGAVTALTRGTATVTAKLPGGATASREITVIPLVQSITFDKSSLKIKNNGSQKVITATVTGDAPEEPIQWISSDESIATVDENGVVTGLKNGTVTVSCTAQYSGKQASCKVKVCDLIQVALTFDDGPSTQYTPKVLDMLEKYGVKATFFLVGNRTTSSTAQGLIKRMSNDGHEIGFHSWAHEFFFNQNQSQIASEYKKFCDSIQKACGKDPTVFRAPGGNITNTALKTIPLPHIMWSVDTKDWQHRNPSKVKSSIIGGLKDGAIILVHDIHGTTYTGVLAALEEIAAKDMDVEFLTVTELLSRKGTAPTAGTTYYKG